MNESKPLIMNKIQGIFGVMLALLLIMCEVGCADRHKQAIELNNEAVDMMNTFHRDSMNMALALFDKAIALDSSYVMAYSNKAKCLTYLGQRKQAVETYARYRDVTDVSLEKMRCWTAMGVNYDVMGDSARADSCYRKAISLEPDIKKEGKYDMNAKVDLLFVKNLLGMKREVDKEWETFRKGNTYKLDSYALNFYHEFIKMDRRQMIEKERKKDESIKHVIDYRTH